MLLFIFWPFANSFIHINSYNFNQRFAVLFLQKHIHKNQKQHGDNKNGSHL